MGRYLVKRILFSTGSLFLLATLTFFLIRFFPGGPFDDEGSLSPQVISSLKKHYSLDLPLVQQYALFLKKVVQFDLGPSVIYPTKTVGQVIQDVMPITFMFGFLAFSIVILIGIPSGVVGYLMKKPHFTSIGQLVILSAPTLFLAPLSVFLFSFVMPLFPITIRDTWVSFVLPTVLLALKPTVSVSRLTQDSLLQTLSEPWIRTAKAFGFDNYKILFHFALKNSLLPALTYMGTVGAGLISGSILVEAIFNIHGMGSLFVESIVNRDYQLVIGLTLFYGAVLTVLTLIVDIFLFSIDPRMKAGIE